MVSNRFNMEADNDIMQNAQAQLQKCALRLAAMSMSLALARQVLEYSSDRRKQALAIAMKIHLDQGESAAAAECKARASDYYANKLSELAEQDRGAEEVVAKYGTTKIMWSSAQMLLAAERSKIGML